MVKQCVNQQNLRAYMLADSFRILNGSKGYTLWPSHPAFLPQLKTGLIAGVAAREKDI